MNTSTKKITKATIKSWVNKNRGNIYISVKSHFDGMVDCVMPVEDSFTLAKACNDMDYRMGISGAWFVGDSRDYFTPYDDGAYVGYEVYNCCGTFLLAIKK